MGKVILLTLIIVAVAVILLCVRVLLVKNGRFRSMHIGDSKAMRQRGIGCVQSEHRKLRREKKHTIDVKNL